MIQSFKKFYDLVKQVLSEKPETRNNDWLLIVWVWKYQGLKEPIEDLMVLKRYAAPDTITRIARDVKSKNPLLKPKNCQSKMFEEKRVREFFRK